MPRRVQRSLRRDGYRRRSPRISTLESTSWKVHGDRKRCLVFGAIEEEGEVERDHDQAKPSNTRAKRIKEKHPRQQLVTKSPDHEHCSTNEDQSWHMEFNKNAKFDGYPPLNDKPYPQSPHPFMPEKRILELVVDILQRRDTYEIFAEPVDPKEVEDYYEIITEPMDFGTMRAKLHEEMYTNLEQFEHDAFLIPMNAMHFNSTATIFYRQARAIYELAKKVFHVLKNDPKNFESEFSGTRRRSARRPQIDGKSLNFSSDLKLGTNVRSDNVNDPSLKDRPCAFNGPLRSIQKYHGFSRKDSCVVSKDRYSAPGARDGRRSNSFEANRRYTYKPYDNDYFGSTMNIVPKQLTQVNYSYIGYKESLLRFVKDLGPAAQMIANRKLQELSKAADLDVQTATSNCWGQLAVESKVSFWSPASDFTSTQKSNCTLDTVTADNTYLDPLAFRPGSLLKTVIDLTDADDGYGEEEKAGRCATNMANGNITLGAKITSNKLEASTSQECDKLLKSFNIFEKDEVIQEKQLNNTQVSFFPPTTSRAGDLLTSSFTRFISDHGNKSVAPTLNSGKPDSKVQQSPMLTFEDFSSQCSRPKRFPCSDWLTYGLSNPPATAVVAKDESSRKQCFSPLATAESNHQVPVVSRFAFDLPFLESRLNQMKCHAGHGGQSSSEAAPSNKNTTSVYNHISEPGTRMVQRPRNDIKCSLFPDTNLSLQL